MKNINEGNQPVRQTEPVLSVRDMTELLIKHYGINEGKFDLFIEFQVGTGVAGPSSEMMFPSAFIGVSKIGLLPVTGESAITVDAATVNPAKPKKIKKKKDD